MAQKTRYKYRFEIRLATFTAAGFLAFLGFQALGDSLSVWVWICFGCSFLMFWKFASTLGGLTVDDRGIERAPLLPGSKRIPWDELREARMEGTGPYSRLVLLGRHEAIEISAQYEGFDRILESIHENRPDLLDPGSKTTFRRSFRTRWVVLSVLAVLTVVLLVRMEVRVYDLLFVYPGWLIPIGILLTYILVLWLVPLTSIRIVGEELHLNYRFRTRRYHFSTIRRIRTELVVRERAGRRTPLPELTEMVLQIDFNNNDDGIELGRFVDGETVVCTALQRWQEEMRMKN